MAGHGIPLDPTKDPVRIYHVNVMTGASLLLRHIAVSRLDKLIVPLDNIHTRCRGPAPENGSARGPRPSDTPRVSRPRDGRNGLLPVCRQYVRNVNSAWGACTPAPLPISQRSTHFKPLGTLKSPHTTTACGAPSRSSDPKTSSIRCDREWERFKRIKRRIISCAQVGSRTNECTRTNQEVYYQPTGAKTQ
jgi:hypothetical protein